MFIHESLMFRVYLKLVDNIQVGMVVNATRSPKDFHLEHLDIFKKAKRYESLFKGNYRGNNNTRVLGSKG